MLTLKESYRVSLIVVLLVVARGSAVAAPPSKVLDAYVKAYTQMGKNAAVIFNHNNTRANAQAKLISTLADAQCKLLSARAAWITAVANANATDAKTLETLQKVRGLALDNDLKHAKTYYEKRKLHEGYRGQHTRERPTQEDVARYAKVSLPQRPADFELEPVRGRISWPGALLQEEFADGRLRLECLFAERRVVSGAPGSSVSQEVQAVTGEMREQLLCGIREMSPVEYLAARRFLESLAHEARFPARIEGVASNVR